MGLPEAVTLKGIRGELNELLKLEENGNGFSGLRVRFPVF